MGVGALNSPTLMDIMLSIGGGGFDCDSPLTFQLDDPYVETSNGAARDLIDRSPFTDAEKAAIGSGNWRGLIAPVTNAFEL